MIIRGGGAIGAADFGGAAPICITLPGGGAAGGALPACAAGVVTRGGTATPGGAVLVAPAAVVAAGGAMGTLGGITTTVGGRYPAATEAGVTILGAVGAGASTAGLGGIAFASTVGFSTAGLTTGRAAGRSATPFCCVMARSTSPGREIFDRSILVLIPSSPRAAREVFAELGVPSERPRRCFRTSSAS
jgi:hypothetical protein